MFGGCRKSRTSCRLMCLPDWLNDQWNIYWMIYIDLYSIWNSPWTDFMLEWLLTRGLIECSLLKYPKILNYSILFYLILWLACLRAGMLGSYSSSWNTFSNPEMHFTKWRSPRACFAQPLLQRMIIQQPPGACPHSNIETHERQSSKAGFPRHSVRNSAHLCKSSSR